MKEGDLVLCTVDKIEGTTVFVHLPNGEKGTIITSEIAPGRIRNIRAHVVPNKKIVCKILRVKGGHIDLSLRRVSVKEKKQVMQKYKQEQTAKSAIHSIIKKDPEKIEEKILKNFPSLSEFLSKAREDPSILDKYIPKESIEQIKKITQKKQKTIEVKKIIKIQCLEDDGVNKIKKVLETNDKKIKITYITAGKFQLNLKSDDYKHANQQLDQLIQTIEEKAKQANCEFSVEDKK